MNKITQVIELVIKINEIHDKLMEQGDRLAYPHADIKIGYYDSELSLWLFDIEMNQHVKRIEYKRYGKSSHNFASRDAFLDACIACLSDLENQEFEVKQQVEQIKLVKASELINFNEVHNHDNNNRRATQCNTSQS